MGFYISNKPESFNCTSEKAVIIVTGKPFDAHPIFKGLEILESNRIYRFQISKILFQLKSNVPLRAITSMFLLNNQLHDTRTSKQSF